jgi:cytochrome c biogenesis protein CcmG/thiol:disulfide interchange protein DsbE
VRRHLYGKLSRVRATTGLTALIGAAGLVLSGCGSATVHSAAPAHGAIASAFRGSPAKLAALHVQADRLLGGGPVAFTARLRELRGHPIVVNKWASWCGPCQTEFPAFQRASVALGRTVAFIGIDGKDSDAAAASFLRRFPVSYPSYLDPSEAVARTIQAAVYFPQTVYIDRQGKQTYDHAGPYLTVAALERDIRRYALQ